MITLISGPQGCGKNTLVQKIWPDCNLERIFSMDLERNKINFVLLTQDLL